MVMVKVVHLTSQHQSLSYVRAEASQLENLSVQNVAKSTKEMYVLHRGQCVMDVTRRDILRQCAIHPGRLHSHDHPHTQPKVVQEVEAHGQNTGKTKNVNIVEMIRSMGLHAKNLQNMNVQEMSIVHDQ